MLKLAVIQVNVITVRSGLDHCISGAFSNVVLDTEHVITAAG